jgi:ribosomal protein L29
MKKVDTKKLDKKTIVDLKKDLDVARDDLRALRFDLASGKVKNITKVQETRKNIARILTTISMKSKEKENDGNK